MYQTNANVVYEKNAYVYVRWSKNYVTCYNILPKNVPNNIFAVAFDLFMRFSDCWVNYLLQ